MSSFNIKDRFIFIHIPKTAGTSMEHVGWVGKPLSKHGDLEYFAEMAETSPDLDIDTYFKWCFVRNPYHKFMSGLLNHILKGRYIAGELSSKDIRGEKEEATKFIKKYGAGYRYPRHAEQSRETNFNRFIVLREQNKFVTIDGEVKMDFIGKYENLEEDWATLSNKLGKGVAPLPHHVRGFQRNYDELYTDETREIIYNYYKKDFEVFGYDR